MDIELPNGAVIQGIPEGTPKDEVMRKAISAGLATEADFGATPKKESSQSISSGSFFGDLKSGMMDLASMAFKNTAGYYKGLRDPIDAAAQLGYNAAPQWMTDAGDYVNNKLARVNPLISEIPKEGIDPVIKDQEAAYQSFRTGTGQQGFDVPRLSGNIVNPATLMPASRIPQAAGLAGKAAEGASVLKKLAAIPRGRVGIGAATGAGFGALSRPVTEGDFWPEKGKQAFVGAVTGGMLPYITGTAARIIRPKSSPQVQTLLKEGVSVTPGQAIGGAAKTIEEKARSLPIVGDVIAASHRRGIQSLNTAGLNRALSPIGDKLPPDIKSGHKAIEYVQNSLSKAYNDVLPKMTGVVDEKLHADLNGIRQMGETLSDSARKQLNRIIDKAVIGKFTKYGKASGETVKQIESELGRLARGYSGSSSFEERQLGAAAREVQSSIRSMLERQNPQHAARLQSINSGYSNFALMQDAASRIGSKEGVATIGNIRSAVRKSDGSVRHGAFAKGKAQMQDLADAADSVLANRIPDSGTAGRVFANAGLLGAGYAEPSVLLAAGGVSIPYLPYIQGGLTSAIARRPDFAEPIARAVRHSTPFLAPGSVPLSLGLLEPAK